MVTLKSKASRDCVANQRPPPDVRGKSYLPPFPTVYFTLDFQKPREKQKLRRSILVECPKAFGNLKNRVDGDPCFFLVSNITTPFLFLSFKGGHKIYFVTDRPSASFLALDEGWEGTYLGRTEGAGDVGNNVRGALATINRNEDFINMTMAVLRTSD